MITANENGTLYELDTITSNENGTLYELDTVVSNENGTLYEIFSAAPDAISGTATGKGNEVYYQASFTVNKEVTATASISNIDCGDGTSAQWAILFVYSGDDVIAENNFIRVFAVSPGMGADDDIATAILPAGKYSIYAVAGSIYEKGSQSGVSTTEYEGSFDYLIEFE